MQNTQSKTSFFIVLIFVACMSQVSTDIYTPSIPAIATYFSVPVSSIQQSLAIYSIGVAITLLIYGPLSEGIGRRTALLIGTVIGFIGILISLFASTAFIFILGRFIQGLGVGAAAGLWRAMFRDNFSGDEMSKYLSYFVNIIIFSVVGAPFLGGLFEQFFTWQVSFIVLGIYTVLTFLLLIFKFEETGLDTKLSNIKPRTIASNYFELICSKQFISYNVISLLCFGCIFAWITESPVLIIKKLGHSPALFGSLVVFIGLAMFFATITNAKWVIKKGGAKILSLGLYIMFLSALCILLCHFIFGLHLLSLMIPMIIFAYGVSLVFPNAFSLAFKNVGHIAGVAGGLYSFIQMLGGVAFGFIISFVPANSALPMAILFMIASLLGLSIAKLASQIDKEKS